ncbi:MULTISPECIES: hypothetical protein [unclassified Bartonella]|uniref:hypothetical protein n=1 Tax=unclassified Bartonella TaxID=2645622 RepID=UPI0035CFDDCE
MLGGVLTQCLLVGRGWAWGAGLGALGLAGAFLMVYSLACGILEPYILDDFLNSSFKSPPFKGMAFVAAVFFSEWFFFRVKFCFSHS